MFSVSCAHEAQRSFSESVRKAHSAQVGSFASSRARRDALVAAKDTPPPPPHQAKLQSRTNL